MVPLTRIKLVTDDYESTVISLNYSGNTKTIVLNFPSPYF